MWISKKDWKATKRLINRLGCTAEVYQMRYEQMQDLTKLLLSIESNQHIVMPEHLQRPCDCGKDHSTQERYDAIVRALPEDLKDVKRLYGSENTDD